MEIIVLEKSAYYALLDESIAYVQNQLKNQNQQDDYVTKQEAKKLLNIKSDTSLAKFRDEQKIKFTYVSPRKILYERASIQQYLNENSM